MRIVLPGALPEPREASELAAHLSAHAPALQRWLARARARSISAEPRRTGCLPHEYWQLMAAGFSPGPDQNFATGLGPLRAQKSAAPGQPVWMAELVHVSPSRDGAALLPAAEISVTQEQSVALFESALPLFSGDGFGLDDPGGQCWRVIPPAGFSAASASPGLVAATSVNDWWPQNDEARVWRRLVNEIQMLWFEHPVNAARQRSGLPPVNSLWLYGGASPSQLRAPDLSDVRVDETLYEASIRQDWHTWLAGLAAVEKALFAGGATPAQLILTGRDRIVELAPGPQWTQWLPGSRDKWRSWWSPQD